MIVLVVGLAVGAVAGYLFGHRSREKLDAFDKAWQTEKAREAGKVDMQLVHLRALSR